MIPSPIRKLKLRARHTPIPANHPWKQTRTNIAFDLIAPKPDMVDFRCDVAESLARIPRFNGHCESGAYSVAQHCVTGALYLHKQAQNEGIDKESCDLLAGYFLLHDAHEAYCGDIITPAAKALAHFGGVSSEEDLRSCYMKIGGVLDPFQAGKNIVEEAIDRLKYTLDTAIHAAAGLEFPLKTKTRHAIKTMDARMLATERRYLLGASPQSWGAEIDVVKPLRIEGKMSVLPWPDAADAYIAALNRYIFKKNPI
jgi:uncharacterized protein